MLLEGGKEEGKTQPANDQSGDDGARRRQRLGLPTADWSKADIVQSSFPKSSGSALPRVNVSLVAAYTVKVGGEDNGIFDTKTFLMITGLTTTSLLPYCGARPPPRPPSLPRHPLG